MLNVREFYKGKGVLVTGATGFIGKVILEKLLWEFPDVLKIYVLVRGKKNESEHQRLKKNIFNSLIMNRLRERYGSQFDSWIFSKVEAVNGDVSSDDLFISKESQDYLVDKVNVIIHSAATIGFSEKLNEAIQLNVYGTLRVLEFAKRCHNFISFCHISTSYTQASMAFHTIEEKIYPLRLPSGENAEEFCERVVQMQPDDISTLTKQVLSYVKHPNTYTLTKNLTETLLQEKHGRIPLAICRPSIVGAALREPVPGWIDAVGAGAGVYLSAGLGISHILPGDVRCISDQVPVDLVAHGCIVTAAYIGHLQQQQKQKESSSEISNDAILKVFHLGTSARNPCTWGMCEDGVMRFWSGHKPKSAVSEPDFHIIKSPFLYNFKFFMLYSLIAKVYGLFSLVVPTKKHLENAKLLKKVEGRVQFFNENFRFFTMNEWIFDTRELEQIVLSPEESRLFFLDPREIDWAVYYQIFCFGMQKYLLKEDATFPTATKSDLVRQSNARIFADLTFMYGNEGSFNHGQLLTREELMQKVLKSKRVQDAIQQTAEQRSIKFHEVAEQEALQIMDTMFANPKMNAARIFSWIMRKLWRKLFNSILVDDGEVETVKNWLQDRGNGPLIVMPTHRSYMDFLVTSYTFFAFNLPLPHIAAGEDFLGMFLIRTLFRYSGAFFIRRNFFQDVLYKAIFTEYVQQILFDGCPIEFFTEGTRSREGKTLQPKLGLLSVILETFFERKLPNISVLPINISYETYLEGSSYARELLGESKQKESLSNLLKARTVLSQQRKHGDINVKFSPIISMSQYVEQLTHRINSNNQQTEGQVFDPFTNVEDKKLVLRHLAYDISRSLNEASVIMPTSMIASILLTYRDGISMEELKHRMQWLQKEIGNRGGKIHVQSREATMDISVVVERGLTLLKDLLIIQKGVMLEPKELMHLHIYRNQLFYLFVEEALLSTTLDSFQHGGDQTSEQEILQELEYLYDLLSLEFIAAPEKPDFKRDIYEKHKKTIISDPELRRFLTQMLQPFIESYWLAAVTALLTIHGSDSSDNGDETDLTNRAQWYGQKLQRHGKLIYGESLSKLQLNNAYAMFLKMGVLVKETNLKNKQMKTSIKFSTSFQSNEILLMSFIGKIARFKTSNQSTVSSKSSLSLLYSMLPSDHGVIHQGGIPLLSKL